MVGCIASTVGHFEVQEVEYGQDYKRHPQAIVVEYRCGERPTFTASIIGCKRGTELVEERLREEALRP